jgi:3-deoxy-7-phosphoheptulonate synthase
MEERFVLLVAGASDILQIGTRNIQNYPLLTTCAKTGKPIMLKRGYGVSLMDWLGAAEYILGEGNEEKVPRMLYFNGNKGLYSRFTPLLLV